MRRVRNQNLLPRIALALVISPHQQNARKLPMRARRRLQRNRIHARNLDQASDSVFIIPRQPCDNDSG